MIKMVYILSKFCDTILIEVIIMRINKTLFKEITRCKTYYGLLEIYRNKKFAFLNDFTEEELKEKLDLMYDPKTYDDLLANDKEFYMKEYYDDVEKEGINVINKLLNLSFKYKEVEKQTKLEFKDKSGHYFETYADGYLEDKESIYLLEVKSCSSNTIIGKYNRFIYEDGIYKLTNKKDEKTEKDLKHLYNRFSDVGKYIYDATFTYYLSTKNNPGNKNIKVYLAVLNSDYILNIKNNFDNIYPKDENGNYVMSVFDVTNVVKENLTFLIQDMNKLINLIQTNKYFPPILGTHCGYKKQESCMFTPICYKPFETKGSIIEYYRQMRYEDMNNGKKLLSDVTYDELTTEKTKLQRSCFVNDERFINIDKIAAGIDIIKYPIYYLDFETFQSPLPRFFGERPNAQSLFQFSLHIETKEGICDIDKDHFSFLANDYNDCRKKLCEELIKLIDLENGGTVIVYNQTFEKQRIKELMEFYPEYKKKLQIIDDHIFDLMYLLVGNKKMFENLGYDDDLFNFYDNKLRGSFSIKKVLPLFSSLSYQNLDVKNGLEAQEAYSKFRYMSTEDIEEERQKLIEYCKLDTWSMVVILNGLKKLINKKNAK
jgi:hypothetical protein